VLKIAILSDIHGNVQALESVLDQVTRESPDHVLCLGDVAATGPGPDEVVERLKRLRAKCIMGNTDEWLLKPRPYDGDDEDQIVISDADLWCSSRLTASSREFMLTFLPKAQMELEEDILLAFHGSPRSSSEWIPSTADDDGISAIFSGEHAKLFVGGHSHRQLYRRYFKSSLLNPGSVGLAFQQAGSKREVIVPDWSEFAVVTSRGPSLEVSLRRVPYDAAAYRRSFEECGIPHGVRVLAALSGHMKLLLDTGKIT
jgi:predicted phosphodiesterase